MGYALLSQLSGESQSGSNAPPFPWHERDPVVGNAGVKQAQQETSSMICSNAVPFDELPRALHFEE